MQQLAVDPVPALVGQEVAVRATTLEEKPVGGLAVAVELPDGTTRELGKTDAAGEVAFTADVAGPHVLSATIDGVRCVASVAFGPARKTWWLAIVCVPLGLALLWVHGRRLFRRSASTA